MYCLLSSVQVKDAEALGFATIFRKALLYHPPNKDLPPNLVSSMLQQMFNLTCTFCEASVREENVSQRILLLLLFVLFINRNSHLFCILEWF